MSKKEIKFEGVLEKPEAISCLQAIIAAVEQGVLTLEGEHESVSLKSGRFIGVEIKVKSKKDKQKLEIEMVLSGQEESELKPLNMNVSSRVPDQHEMLDAVSENPEPDDETGETSATDPGGALSDPKKD